jgi:hypothetical protein
VLLEIWNRGIPALVNACCRALDGRVRRANGGFTYRSVGEFREALDFLLSHDDSVKPSAVRAWRAWNANTAGQS